MKQDYLCNPQEGAPEGEYELLQQLEQDLAVFRKEGPVPMPTLPPRQLRQEKPIWRIFAYGLAGSVLVACLVFGVNLLLEPPEPPYAVRSQTALLVNGHAWTEETDLEFGGVLRTSAEGSFTLEIAALGTARMEGAGKMKLLPPLDAQGDGRFRLFLNFGTLEVLVDAPAQAFLIETPWFQVWDLGCQYRLELDAGGNGQLAVTLGAVRFQSEEQKLRLNAGTSIRIRGGRAVTD